MKIPLVNDSLEKSLNLSLEAQLQKNDTPCKSSEVLTGCPYCDNPTYRESGKTYKGKQKYKCCSCKRVFSDGFLDTKVLDMAQGFCRVCPRCLSPFFKRKGSIEEAMVFVCRTENCDNYFIEYLNDISITFNSIECPKCQSPLIKDLSRRGAYQCLKCQQNIYYKTLNEYLDRKKFYAEHIVTAKSLECPRCEGPYREIGATESGRRFYCRECSYQFHQPNLEKYLQEKKTGFCKVCIYCFSPVSKGGKNGSGILAFICKNKECERRFTDQTQIKEPCPPCFYCSGENVTKRGIYREEQVYKCKDCKKSFSSLTQEPIVTENHICPNCQSRDLVGAGKNQDGSQRYHCKCCDRWLTENSINAHTSRHYLNRLRLIKQAEIDASEQDSLPMTERNIWELKDLGYLHPHIKTLRFYSIKQPWLKELTKRFVKLMLPIISVTTASRYIQSLKLFSDFLVERFPTAEPKDINREVIMDFIVWLAGRDLKAHNHLLSVIKQFFEWCNSEEVEDFPVRLLFHSDFPKRSKFLPRYIPEEVMQQLNLHIDKLAEPIMRMLLVLQECGLRISELCHLRFNCLIQDSVGDCFLKYYQQKTKKENIIPLRPETVAVIREQQDYIRNALNSNFEYLFCARDASTGNSCKDFIPVDKPSSINSFGRAIKVLARDCQITDANGKLWNFQSHQFRHTAATRMINDGVPPHIIQRYLGHENPAATAVYTHLHDQTLKKEWAKFQGKIVNVEGKAIEPSLIRDDDEDLQWMKQNIMAQALPNGYCSLPTISGGCPHANACLSCTHFRTTIDFLDTHKQQLQKTEKVISKAEANGWQRQAEMNRKVATNLQSIICTLEESV